MRERTSTYRTQSPDTSFEAEQVLIELYRGMPLVERVRRVFELQRMVEEAALVGIRERHPGCTEREARLRLASLEYDRELMIRAFGWDPLERGY